MDKPCEYCIGIKKSTPARPRHRYKYCPMCRRELKTTEKDKLKRIKTTLEEVLENINKLTCECSSYGGYRCKLCEWKETLRRLKEEVDIALENIG